MFLEKKKVERPVIEVGTIRKLNNLKNNGIDSSSIVILNEIIRNYINSKFKIYPSLTIEEAIRKLDEKKIKKTTKIDLAHLLTQISLKEYQDALPPTKEEMEELIKNAIETLKRIGFGKKFKGDVEEELKNRMSKEEKSKRYKELEKELKSLREKIQIDWEKPETRKVYEKIRREYNHLKDEEKKIIYPKIMALFKLKGN